MRVELRHLTKKFGSLTALDNFSLTLEPGQVTALIGLNGAGKTTLFRCLAGINAPTRGDVLFDGARFSRERLDLRRRMTFLADFPALYSGMSTLEHIALMVRVYERPAADLEERLIPILGDMDLLAQAEAPIARLSRGQMYKAALAGLFAVQPDLWLLDEPFASGLDPRGLGVLKAQARLAAAQGAAILYSTQILEVAQKFSDRVCILDRGKLRAEFSRAELNALPETGPASIEARLSQFRDATP